MKEIVIATRNPGKLEEFKVLMKDLDQRYREWVKNLFSGKAG